MHLAQVQVSNPQICEEIASSRSSAIGDDILPMIITRLYNIHMRCKLITIHFLRLAFFFLLLSCTPAPEPSLETKFLVYRFDPPAFLEYSSDFRPVKEIPISLSPHCGLLNLSPPPRGSFITIEFNCPSGQAVFFLNTDTSELKPAFSESDSHFLAWTSDGEAAYLKVDSLGNARVLRISVTGAQEFIPLPAVTYDLAPVPNGREFTFTFSRGLGVGSEIWFAQRDGRIVEQLIADQFNYISFARWSPDGKQIAFIKIPDTQTPFTVGEVWVMNANGSRARKLADADAGHGHAANWSPDGRSIAFVLRENPEDENANQSSNALISNVYTADVKSGKINQVTHFENARVETPVWSPDGNTLAFNVVINGRMEVQIADLTAGQIRPLMTESTCCPAWMRK